MSSEANETPPAELDFPGPPTPFQTRFGTQLTFGTPRSGKSYSVARRAGAWWAQKQHRSLTILTREGNTGYDGLVGHCSGMMYDLKDILPGNTDSIISDEGVVAIKCPSGPGKSEMRSLAEVLSQFEDAAHEPGDTALIADDVILSAISNRRRRRRSKDKSRDSIRHEVVQAYDDLYQHPSDTSYLWHVTPRWQLLPDSEPAHPALPIQNPAFRYDAIELFTGRFSGELSPELELGDSEKEFLRARAGLYRPAEGRGVSIGLARPGRYDDWYRFKEEATPPEHAMLTYSGRPFDFNLEEELNA